MLPSSPPLPPLPSPRYSLQEQIGAGQFGLVCKGLWKIGDAVLEVAVKTLKAGSLEEDKVKFLQEAAIMGQFVHPNVVKLHGVVTVGEPVSHMFFGGEGGEEYSQTVS